MNSEDTIREQVRRLGQKRVADAANVRLTTLNSWIKNPDRSMRADHLEAVKSAVRNLKGAAPSSDGALTVGGEQFVALPAFDIRATAGDGGLMQDGEPLFYQLFREQWLRRRTRAPVEALSLIEVSGDSMAGTLDSGDLILVDTTLQSFKGEGVYVLMVEDALFVKRVSLDPDSGSIILLSDNSRYPPIRVNKRERVRIIGRVIWAGRSFV